MKKNLINLTIGIIGGILGSFLFLQFAQNESKVSTQEVFYDTSNTVAPVEVTSSSNSFEHTDLLPDEKIIGNFSDAARISNQSVVYIKTYASNEGRRMTWMDYYFGQRSQNENMALGSGSGVIFSEDGYIVSNNHVVKGADKIEVVYNKRTYEAKLIGVAPSTDLSLLKIEANNLPAIRVASSREVNVGDWVLAVGNPFNLTSTVTAGIVSAKGRKINIFNDVFPIESFIQTDAAINPGNSGGALVNVHGNLIGINTFILSKTGSYAGYGFAVPSDIVAKVVNDLKKYGEVQKAFMGTKVIEVNEDIAQKLKLKEITGVVITELRRDMAADKGGLEPGDVIIEIDNYPIHSQADYDEQLSFYVPGDEIQIKYVRNGDMSVSRIQLTNITGTTTLSKKEKFNAESLGAVFESVSDLEKAKLKTKSGLKVSTVKKGGLIHRMGLKKNMVIASVNRYPVNQVDDLVELLTNLRGRVIVEVYTDEGRRDFYSYYF